MDVSCFVALLPCLPAHILERVEISTEDDYVLPLYIYAFKRKRTFSPTNSLTNAFHRFAASEDIALRMRLQQEHVYVAEHVYVSDSIVS